jgi:hypothetical protein
MEILSQGDNWFIFHLLSAADLTNVRRANAHFSDDLLSALLNEPIPGQGILWSSVGGTPYPVSIRALSFEKMFPPLDPLYTMPAAETFARALRDRFAGTLQETVLANQARAETLHISSNGSEQITDDSLLTDTDDDSIDVLAAIEDEAIARLRDNVALIQKIAQDGAAWGALKAFFIGILPPTLDDRDSIAYQLVSKALNRIFGQQGDAWHTFKRPREDGSSTTYVKSGISSQ